jgi:heme/copper-type cytochrome/quinol oxidase subunit 2
MDIFDPAPSALPEPRDATTSLWWSFSSVTVLMTAIGIPLVPVFSVIALVYHVKATRAWSREPERFRKPRIISPVLAILALALAALVVAMGLFTGLLAR